MQDAPGPGGIGLADEVARVESIAHWIADSWMEGMRWEAGEDVDGGLEKIAWGSGEEGVAEVAWMRGRTMEADVMRILVN